MQATRIPAPVMFLPNSPRLGSRLLLGIGAVAFTARAQAPVSILEELVNTRVITASKKSEIELEAPASVFVITGPEMRARGYRTLFDLLQDVPGVINYPHQVGEMFMGTPTVRGSFLPRRLKLMINGMTVDPKDGSGTSWAERFPIEGIQQVEFIQGPYASIYGRNTFSGVINVILVPGQQLSGGEADLLVGSYGQRQGTILFGTRQGRTDVLVSLFKNVSERGVDLAADYPEYYSLEARLRNGATFADGISREYVFPWDHSDLFASVKHDSGLSFDLSANLSRYGKNPTFSALFYAAPPESRVEEDTLTGRVKYDFQKGEALSGSTSLGYQTYDWKAPNHYLQGVRKFYTRASRALSLTQDLRYTFSARNSLYLGVAYDDVDFRPFAPTAAVPDPAPYYAPYQSNRFFNVTVQDEFALTPRIKAVAGLMYERSNAYKRNVVLPRFALVLRPRPTTSIKLLYSRGFLTPSSEAQADQITPGGDMTKGTADLSPEYITSYELALAHAQGASFFASLSLYRNQVSDVIQRVLDPNLPAPYMAIYKNLGTSEATGADLLLKVGLPRRAKLFLAYSYVDGSYDRENPDHTFSRVKRLPVAAKHHAKLGIQVPLGERFQLYLHDLWYGDRTTYREELYGRYQFATPGYRLKGYNLVDVVLNSTSALHPSWSFSLGINNLLDRKGFDPPYSEATTVSAFVPIRRRSLQLQARFTF